MKRLTERDAYWYGEEFWTSAKEPDDDEIDEIYMKLKQYEDLEEQGLLLRLPYNLETCGVIYYVDEKDSEIYRLTADKIQISKMMISRKFILTIDSFDFFLEDFGKTVFLTRTEAEQALAEMEKEK